MTVSAEVEAPVVQKRPDPRLGPVLAIAGLVIAILATVVTAAAELYLTPLRIGGVPIGVGVVFAAGVRTREGDYLLSGNDWIALVMILVGSLSFAVYAYRLILTRPKL